MVAIKPSSTDGDPVRALIEAGRHREALIACTRTHGEALGRFCMAQLGRQGEAEETVQETLLAAYHAFPQYRGEGSTSAWLFGIARRMCARRLTKRARRQRRLELVHSTPTPTPLPDEMLVLQERAQKVRSVLAQMKPSDREVLTLRFEGQLSYREIGQMLAIDEATARKRVSRALVRFKDRCVAEPALPPSPQPTHTPQHPTTAEHADQNGGLV